MFHMVFDLFIVFIRSDISRQIYGLAIIVMSMGYCLSACSLGEKPWWQYSGSIPAAGLLYGAKAGSLSKPRE